MLQTSDICETLFENEAAVLMARIVDATGRPVCKRQVAAIAYSFYDLDVCSGEPVCTVSGHDQQFLKVGEVFLDALACDDAWNLDVAGYNFRHEIRAHADGSFPRCRARYEIRYLFVPKFGEPIVIRFSVRINSR